MEQYNSCNHGDPRCDGPLAKPNRPCCQQCADTYQELVAQGKIPDFMALSNYMAGDVEIEVVETQEDLVGDVVTKVWQ